MVLGMNITSWCLCSTVYSLGPSPSLQGFGAVIVVVILGKDSVGLRSSAALFLIDRQVQLVPATSPALADRQPSATALAGPIVSWTSTILEVPRGTNAMAHLDDAC